MLRINYYISGHGYGHSTRSAQIITALLDDDESTQITVITTAPSHLFPSSDRVSFVALEIDSAIIQPQPYSIDAASSFNQLHAFLRAATAEEWQVNTKAILDSNQCNLILADAPYPIAWASHAHKIPSILISNFSFDAIFNQLLTYLPSPAADAGATTVRDLEGLYNTYDYLIRLPGFIEFPFVKRYWSESDIQTRLIDVPLVFRRPRSSRQVTLNALNIPATLHHAKILLVQFGGQILDSSASRIPELPDGWICLSSLELNHPRFFKFPPNIYSPDLVSISDVVLGKIGYGTVSECVGLDKSLVYVRRPMFAEEPGLLEYMRKNGICKEISVQDFESGNWIPAIKSAENSRDGWKIREVGEGSAHVVKVIKGLTRYL